MTTMGGTVRGYVVASADPDKITLPPEILAKGVARYGVAATRYQPPGTRWGVQAVLIAYIEQAGNWL